MGDLERVQVVSSEDGEDAVESGNLVEYEGEVDELGGCSERDKVEETLCAHTVSHWVPNTRD